MTSLSVILVLCVTIIHSASSHPAHTAVDDNGNGLGVIGGDTANIEDAPFMAAMVRIRNGELEFLCGASIIHEQFILTAAHCCKDYKSVLIKVGSEKILEGGQIYPSEAIVVHPYYIKSVIVDYDVCVIKLNDTLTFGPTVGKITLADDTVELYDGTQLTALGWGDTTEKGELSSVLREVNVPFVSKRRCGDKYNGGLTINMICAGEFNSDVCNGDSGGPLTLMNAIQVGITSFGDGCGREVGVYASVAGMRPWINGVIHKLS